MTKVTSPPAWPRISSAASSPLSRLRHSRTTLAPRLEYVKGADVGLKVAVGLVVEIGVVEVVVVGVGAWPEYRAVNLFTFKTHFYLSFCVQISVV